MGIPAILLGLQLSAWIFFIPVIRDGHFDFRHLYTAGYMVRTGHAFELYDYEAQKHFENILISREEIALPFNHLAYEALLFVPLSLFTFRQAYFLFLAVNSAFLAGAYCIMRPCIRNLVYAWQWLGPLMFVTFLPNAAALMQGQDSILLMCLFAGTCRALASNAPVLAGLLLGMGLFKFQIVLPVAALFAVWRSWRFVAGFCASGVAVSTISIAMVGISQLKVYARSLFMMGIALSSNADQFRYGISPRAMPNLRGLIFGLFEGRMPGVWIQVITIALSVFAMVLAARAGTNEPDQDRFLLAVVTSALVSYHFLIHDMSVLLIPISVLVSRNLFSKPGSGAGWNQLRGAALLFVLPIWMSFAARLFFVVSSGPLILLFVLAWKARPSSSRSAVA